MTSFTPQEIEQFLQQFFDVVGARQYTGARYVPIFGRKGEPSIAWDNTAPYEPLTVVMYQGASYVSRQYVPAGVNIDDADYWANTYKFNAQVEMLAQRLDDVADAAETANTLLETVLPLDSFDADNTVKDYVDETKREIMGDAVPFPLPPASKYGTEGQVLATNANGTTLWTDPVVPDAEDVATAVDAWLDDHPEATTTVLDGSVTTAKLADKAVTDAKLANVDGVKRRLDSLNMSNAIGNPPASSLNQGAWTATGNTNSSSTRVRMTREMADELYYLHVDEGFQATVLIEPKATFQTQFAYYNINTDTLSNVPPNTWVQDLNLGYIRQFASNVHTLSVIFRRSDDSDLTPSDVIGSIHCFRSPEYSISELTERIDDMEAFGTCILSLGSFLTFGGRGGSTPLNVSQNTIRLTSARPLPKSTRRLTCIAGFTMRLLGANGDGSATGFIGDWSQDIDVAAVRDTPAYADTRLYVNVKKDDESDFLYPEITACATIYLDNQYATPYRNGVFASLGDSITYGFIPRNYYGYSGQLQSFASLAASRLGMSFANMGISGSTVAVVTGRNPMCERVSTLPQEANIVTLMGGTNDIRNDVPLGTFLSTDTTTFYGALNVTMHDLYQRYLGAGISTNIGNTIGRKVVVCTPPKLLLTSAATIDGDGTLWDFDDFCEAIVRTAEYYGFDVVDFQHECKVNPALLQSLQGTEPGYTGFYNPLMPDGTHPSQEAAHIMAECLLEKIGLLR